MAIKSITIDKLTEEKVDENNTTSDSGTLKKKIGFKVINDKDEVYIIDKWLTIVDGKSDDDYSKEAYDASKSQIESWDNNFAKIGKAFNPDTGKIE